MLKIIHCDNGTNFRGMCNELKKVFEEFENNKINNSENKIKWKFNPPIAPHMGGAWERLIRSVKTALMIIFKDRAPREDVLLNVHERLENRTNLR